jgi:hypothetical protein
VVRTGVSEKEPARNEENNKVTKGRKMKMVQGSRFKVQRLLVLIALMMCSAAFATVTETESKETPQACNGSSVAFTFDFPVSATSEVIVTLRTILTGAEDVLVETNEYTVSAVNNDYSSGGTVTTVATYSGDYTISLSRRTTQTQNTNLRDTGALRFSAMQTALDKLTRIVQELQEEIRRAPRIPISDTSITTDLDDSVQRASTVLGFDSSGNFTALDAVPTGSVSVSAFMGTVLDDADAAAAKTTLAVPTISAFAETVIDDATAAAARTTLGAVGLTGNETVGGNKTFSGTTTLSGITTVADASLMASTAAPSTDAMIVNKKYADDAHKPYARMYGTAAQANLTDVTWTTITLDTDTFDSGTITNLSSYKITPAVAGYYIIIGQITYENAIAEKTYYAQIYKNGTTATATRSQQNGAATTDVSVTVQDVVLLDADDYITLRGYVNCGANTVDINVGTADTYLILYRL